MIDHFLKILWKGNLIVFNVSRWLKSDQLAPLVTYKVEEVGYGDLIHLYLYI